MFKYYNGKIDTLNQNLKAKDDQISQLVMDNGDLLVIRDSYELKANQLEDQLNISKKEFKELEKKLNSSIKYIAKLEAQVNIKDTIVTTRDSIIYIDKERYTTYFKYHDQWLSLKGFNEVNNDDINTSIYDVSICAPITMGLTNDNKIFVQSSNPYVVIPQIEGAYLDGYDIKPKRTTFNWGFQVGFGTMYDIIDKSLVIGPYGGIGLEINF
jgi:hypothetical protein